MARHQGEMTILTYLEEMPFHFRLLFLAGAEGSFTKQRDNGLVTVNCLRSISSTVKRRFHLALS